jgi:N-acetylneuraminate synthase
MYKNPIIIAEVGCNHKGDFNIAKDFIEMASVFCKVDIVKFQKRNPKELLTEEQYNAPHPNPHNSYGDTYGEHREFLEFNLEQHIELNSSSVWDMTSAKEIASLNPKMIKIPSAMNTNFKMLEWLYDNYNGEIHISTGMSTKKEIDDIVNFAIEKKRNKDIVLYNCTSGYPVPAQDVCLLEISYLKEKYSDKVKDIGFSGHHNGISLDIAAYTLGANIIERHFTLNRTWKGTDHAASLEPDGLRRLARDIRKTQKALTYKSEEILEIEKPQRKKLKYRG